MKNFYSIKTPIISFIIFIVSISYCRAQLKKGVSIYGFDLNYNTSTTKYDSGDDSDKTYSFSVMPTFGVFINSHVLVGLKTNWTKTRNADVNTPDFSISNSTSKGHSFGPFVRYYKMFSDKAGFFVQGEMAWAKNKLTYTLEDTQSNSEFDIEDHIKSFQAGVRPGVVFFIGKRVALESTLGFIGYSKSKTDNSWVPANLDSSNKGFQFSLSPGTLNFGFRYYLIK